MHHANIHAYVHTSRHTYTYTHTLFWYIHTNQYDIQTNTFESTVHTYLIKVQILFDVNTKNASPIIVWEDGVWCSWRVLASAGKLASQNVDKRVKKSHKKICNDIFFLPTEKKEIIRTERKDRKVTMAIKFNSIVFWRSAADSLPRCGRRTDRRAEWCSRYPAGLGRSYTHMPPCWLRWTEKGAAILGAFCKLLLISYHWLANIEIK